MIKGPAFQFMFNAPEKMTTRCHGCGGSGGKLVFYSGGETGKTVLADKPCPTCKGAKKFPGFQAPV